MDQDEPTSDLAAEQAVFRNCADVLEALLAAFRGAADRPGGLPAAELDTLRGLSRRAAILIASVAFPIPGSVEDRHGR